MANPPASKLKKWIFLAAAGVFFVLGLAGVVIPGLPTTPFLLLTSYFLLRSSPRLNKALLHSRLFGPILTDWQDHGGVRLDIKIKAIGIVVLTVGTTVYFSGYALWPSVIVLTLAAIGIFVILRLPSLKRP